MTINCQLKTNMEEQQFKDDSTIYSFREANSSSNFQLPAIGKDRHKNKQPKQSPHKVPQIHSPHTNSSQTYSSLSLHNPADSESENKITIPNPFILNKSFNEEEDDANIPIIPVIEEPPSYVADRKTYISSPNFMLDRIHPRPNQKTISTTELFNITDNNPQKNQRRQSAQPNPSTNYNKSKTCEESFSYYVAMSSKGRMISESSKMAKIENNNQIKPIEFEDDQKVGQGKSNNDSLYSELDEISQESQRHKSGCCMRSIKAEEYGQNSKCDSCLIF